MRSHYQVPSRSKSMLQVARKIIHPFLLKQMMPRQGTHCDTQGFQTEEKKTTMNLFFYWTVFVGAVFAPCSHGQGLVKETTNGSTALQPWLVGLTAVTVFLFVMFVANLIHRIFFFQKKDDKDEMENIETKHSTEQNVYENKAMDPEEGDLETNM